jgi:hypothetical protein
MATTQSPEPLDERLAALAMQFLTQAEDGSATTEQHAQFRLAQVESLSDFARQIEVEYARLTAHEIPTCAQGLALARFLAPHLRDRSIGAHVCRGGQGLPEDYLHVRFTDGYEGGIAPDGRTST